MRLGILGGSFDPVHYGHLLVAESCREQCQLDEIWFIPAMVSPHKLADRPAPAPHRVEMLRLAVAGNPAFSVSTIEVDRGGVSFTVDTLREVRERRPADDLFLLLGADSLADLPRWREPGRICELALPVAVVRPGFDEPNYDLLGELLPQPRLRLAERTRVSMPRIELSSTDLRRRAASGLSLRYRTPRAVEKYIENHALYQASNAGSGESSATSPAAP